MEGQEENNTPQTTAGVNSGGVASSDSSLANNEELDTVSNPESGVSPDSSQVSEKNNENESAVESSTKGSDQVEEETDRLSVPESPNTTEVEEKRTTDSKSADDDTVNVVERLKSDLKEREEAEESDTLNAQDELNMIRSLLEAEASQDARTLLDAQDSILSSNLSNEVNVGEKASNDRVRKLREKIEVNSLKTPTMSSMISIAAEKVQNSDNGDEGNETSASSSSGVFKFDDINGMADEEISTFIGSYEENKCLSEMISQLNTEDFEHLFRADPSFMDDFRWWCRVCLRARRYRQKRAIQLLKSYADWRLSSEIYKADQSRLKDQVETGFLLFLDDVRCVEGRAIIVIRLALHDPKKFQPKDVVTALHYVVLYGLKSDPIVQAKGFTVLMDMSETGYSNFDMGVASAVSKALNSTLPMRYGKLIVYNPPFFFSTLFKLIYIFLSTKMRQRMVRVFASSKNPITSPLFKYIQQACLPTFYCGNHHVDPETFAMEVLGTLTKQ